MAYTTPTGLNSTNDLLVYVNNELLQGVLGIGIILLVWILIFINVQRSSTVDKAFTVASFVNAILAVFFWTMGIVTDFILILMIVMTIAGVIWTMSSKS